MIHDTWYMHGTCLPYRLYTIPCSIVVMSFPFVIAHHSVLPLIVQMDDMADRTSLQFQEEATGGSAQTDSRYRRSTAQRA